ncbi:hypothetical protein Avbf_13477 [Armadillidium vulgare]|nr:hypothetical protein Avbf_13477 [Armadillidium vulgare]
MWDDYVFRFQFGWREGRERGAIVRIGYVFTMYYAFYVIYGQLKMSSTLTKVRKLNTSEIICENCNSEFNIGIICFWLTLEFKNKVPEEQIKEALRILSRNMDILHMCIRKENGHYWFYKMDEEKIPLQVLKNQSPESVYWKRDEHMY